MDKSNWTDIKPAEPRYRGGYPAYTPEEADLMRCSTTMHRTIDFARRVCELADVKEKALARAQAISTLVTCLDDIGVTGGGDNPECEAAVDELHDLAGELDGDEDRLADEIDALAYEFITREFVWSEARTRYPGDEPPAWREDFLRWHHAEDLTAESMRELPIMQAGKRGEGGARARRREDREAVRKPSAAAGLDVIDPNSEWRYCNPTN